jgi:bifunctional DNA-binding transcriptional regulator/antitoxin component of YhaV-PrlF toxin-antitoxin module
MSTIPFNDAPKKFTAKILPDGKVTVPVELREVFGLKGGELIEFEIVQIIRMEAKQ